jgi:hypothetical protein
VYELDELAVQELHGLLDLDDVRVVAHETARRPEVDDALGLSTRAKDAPSAIMTT